MTTSNIFSCLPYDLKLDITNHLDHRDILAFNESLRRDERVYKKLPPDYALMIHIRAIKQKYTSLATKANEAHRGVSLFARWGFAKPSRNAVAIFVSSYTQLFTFMADPINAPMFAYQCGVKEKQGDMLFYWRNDAEYEEEFYSFLHDQQVADFQFAATKAWDAINATPFLRHITLMKPAIF